MPSFTNTFGGTNIYPSDVSYRAITLSANTTLAWPTEVATDSNVAAEIMDVTATVAGLTIRMPPAIEASVGQTALFFNPGANAFTIADNGGNVITVVAAGESWQVYITDNTTANGAWRTVEYGAGTSAPAAGSLAGKGIKAITTTLNQSMPVVTYPIIPGTYSYTLDEALRASTVIWDSSSTGTLTFAQATANGADWFCHIRNNGAGSVVLNCAVGDQINGVSSLTFGPGDSATLICDGNNYFTIGQGNASTSGILAFDYVALDLTGVVSPYILQGVELNRVSYNFIGTLTSNMEIVVPLNLQQYWVKNSTSGPHTLVVKTLSGGGVQVQQGYAQILYCNGVNVVAANDPPGVTDIPVSAGGIYVDNFSGNGITQIFNLTYAVINEDRTQVYVNGVYQQKNTYTVSGATLTFSVAPPVGATIEVVSLGAANYPANSVSFTPYGNLTSTNVQDAIEEEVDDLAAGTGSSLIGYNQGGTSAVNRTVESRLQDYVSVKDFGAVGDGVTDDTAAFVAAVAASLAVWVPEGNYKITSAIQLRPGQHIFGVNGGQYDDSTSITNSAVGGGIFQMVQGTTPSGQLDGCTIENLRLTADFPIRLNDENQLIDAAGPTPAIKRPVIRHCSLAARALGVGTGISMSKVFGFLIEGCRLQRFDIHLLLQGCDIGRVVLNRFIDASSYHILEIGTNMYGSQNHIENNDILVGRSGATFIKTCSNHVRLYNNYIEQSGGSIASGAIDMTSIGCPQYGPNVPTNPLTIVCQDNRVDAHALFSDFIHYLDGNNPARSVKLYDPGTPGIPAADGVLLKIAGDYLQAGYNPFHNVNYDITIPNTYNYNKFRNTDAPAVTRSGATITASNVANNKGFPVNDAGYECGYNGSDAIVITPTMTGTKSPFYVMLPEVSATVRHSLEVGVSYQIYITARSPASETLNSSWAVGFTSGGTPTAVALTPSYTTTLVATVAAPAVSNLFGVYFVRSTTTDDIFIKSIQFVRV